MLTYKVEKFFKVEKYSEMMKSVSKNVEYSQRKFRDCILTKTLPPTKVIGVSSVAWQSLEVFKRSAHGVQNAELLYSTKIKRLFLDAKVCSHTKLRASLNLMRIQKRRKVCFKMRNACQDNKSTEVLCRC